MPAARFIAANIPHAQLITYPTGGHVWVGHDAELFAHVDRVPAGQPSLHRHQPLGLMGVRGPHRRARNGSGSRSTVRSRGRAPRCGANSICWAAQPVDLLVLTDDVDRHGTCGRACGPRCPPRSEPRIGSTPVIFRPTSPARPCSGSRHARPARCGRPCGCRAVPVLALRVSVEDVIPIPRHRLTAVRLRLSARKAGRVAAEDRGAP